MYAAGGVLLFGVLLFFSTVLNGMPVPADFVVIPARFRGAVCGNRDGVRSAVSLGKAVDPANVYNLRPARQLYSHPAGFSRQWGG